MHELRCGNKKHGAVIDDHVVEIKCNSKFCGAGPGVTVLHRFDVKSATLLETKRYKDPGREGK